MSHRGMNKGDGSGKYTIWFRKNRSSRWPQEEAAGVDVEGTCAVASFL